MIFENRLKLQFDDDHHYDDDGDDDDDDDHEDDHDIEGNDDENIINDDKKKIVPSGSAPPHTSWQVPTMSKYDGHDDDEEKYDTLESWLAKVFLIMRQKCRLNVEEPKPTVALGDDEEKGQNWHSWEIPMKEPWMKFSDQSIG